MRRVCGHRVGEGEGGYTRKGYRCMEHAAVEHVGKYSCCTAVLTAALLTLGTYSRRTDLRRVFDDHELEDAVVVAELEDVIVLQLDEPLGRQLDLVVVEEGAVSRADIHQVAAHVAVLRAALSELQNSVLFGDKVAVFVVSDEHIG